MSLCNRALGLQNGRIRNNQITASSEVNRYHAAWIGRLGRVKAGRYIGAWCPKHRNHNQWFKVDFRRLMKITKIATQGRQDAGHWVTSYYLSSSVDNVHWAIYRFRSANKVFSRISTIVCSSAMITPKIVHHIYLKCYLLASHGKPHANPRKSTPLEWRNVI